jgi:tyrosine decarboxylase
MSHDPPNTDGPIDVRALFLGPKAENREFFEKSVAFLIQEHVHWRRDFHPSDAPIFSAEQRRQSSFATVEDRTQELLEELTSRLKSTSTPWFSTRYLGHMNSDTLMISNLAEIATILYNPNNVAYESSVATSQMEVEVGRDFAQLMGYDAERAWGHITTDGTVANYEALWLARNLKSLPFAVRTVLPHLVPGLDDWALLNMSTLEILDLLDVAKGDKAEYAKVLAATSRGTGTGHGELGKVLVPSTRHYSWDKAADLLGIGVNNLISIPVDQRYRMDLTALQEVIDELVANKTPILALVGVVGTTEEGAIDDIAGMAALRERNATRGVNFYFHIDAAYGGYARALFLDNDHTFMPYERLQERLAEGDFTSAREWPTRQVWSAYGSMWSADSITVDPHKMGYVPYAAGGMTVRDRRILGLISYSAAYVFEDPSNLEVSLGSVVLEGSKSGMTAAGVWGAHRLIPLNFSGYGQLIARSWSGAQTFADVLALVADIEVAGHRVICEPVMADPDFNIVCMAFNLAGNEDLAKMNALNEEIYHRFSYEYGPLYQDDWITSHTELDHAVYGDVPADFVKRMGISETEWDRVGHVSVLRSCVMHPWIAESTSYPERWQSFLAIITQELERILTKAGADYGRTAVTPAA